MARTVFLDDMGRQVAVGKQLGRGGEATVFAVEDDRNLVAKVYHRPPDREGAAKLSRMVELRDDRLLKLAAWPIGTIRTKSDSAIAGILMKNVSGLKDIHLLYNPKSRLREFPAKADWRFLIHTAANVARAFAVIHEHMHVIGDVNQSNVRVSPESAVVNLIDCDSFQVFSNGHYFLCGVGVPLYTPPELQGKQFKSIIRTPNHDNFGLAILIFHLLFMGRHPFAGKFLGRGEMPIEKAIAEYRFAFAPDQQRTLMQPPPNCISFAQVPPEIRTHFLQAFSLQGSQSGRPDSPKWVAALDALGRELRQCSNNTAHTFYQGGAECPWCSLEVRSGIVLFVSYTFTDGLTGFNIETIWARINLVQSPGPGSPPDFAAISANARATMQARVAGWKRRAQIAIATVVVLAIIGGCLAAGVGAVTFFIALVCIGVAQSVVGKSGAAKKQFESETRAAEARHRSIQERWNREASDESFAAKVRELGSLGGEYRQLPNRRQQRIRDLERDSYNIQLKHFLERFDIASAEISHIKDSRKAMLASYGIDTAADVTAASIEAVPGFGQFLTQQMTAWRQSLEGRFRFDPKRGVDPADVQRIDREIGKRKTEIESTLIRGPNELEALRRRILSQRSQIAVELERAMTEVAQARANAQAA
jgi:DNA-binding helix-hairpin-helix protein with protein kinase domain